MNMEKCITSFEPTYKELKHGSLILKRISGESFEPTYKELKPEKK